MPDTGEGLTARYETLDDCISGADAVRIFFYGLFMDEKLLVTKGLKPRAVTVGFVDDYGVHIGARATLVSRPGARAYGVIMDIAAQEVADLYAEDSVADYVPETVMVDLMTGRCLEATCYNLPAAKIVGVNKDYAQSLLNLATKLGFPDEYLEQIRQAAA